MTTSQTDERRTDIISKMVGVISAETQLKRTLLEGFMIKSPYATYKLEEYVETIRKANEEVIHGFEQLGELL